MKKLLLLLALIFSMMSCTKYEDGIGTITVTHYSEVDRLQIDIPGVNTPTVIFFNNTIGYDVSPGRYTVYAKALKTYEPLDGYKWVKTYKIRVRANLTYDIIVTD